jgi:hypothetical protein
MNMLFLGSLKGLLTVERGENIKSFHPDPLSHGLQKLLIVIYQQNIYFFFFHVSPSFNPGGNDLSLDISPVSII